MRAISEEITAWKKQLPADVQLVAVSKEQPLDRISDAYDAGHRHFGESKAQALLMRYRSLPKDIQWHMIGHLQRNKVRLIAPFVHLIQSIDSIRLLRQIEQEGKKQNRLLSGLLQVHIAEDDTQKYGLKSEQMSEILDKSVLDELTHVQIVGLMGMASHSKDKSKIRQQFDSLRHQFNTIRQSVQHPRIKMEVLSMGMSSDYEEAIASGSNMLRIGAAIFGPRPPKEL